MSSSLVLSVRFLFSLSNSLSWQNRLLVIERGRRRMRVLAGMRRNGARLEDEADAELIAGILCTSSVCFGSWRRSLSAC